jgi:hypothetical protein
MMTDKSKWTYINETLNGTKGLDVPQLNSLKVLKSIGSTGTINKTDITGLIIGGAVGWYVANKFPNMIVKYLGIIVGSEIGIIIARLFGGGTSE